MPMMSARANMCASFVLPGLQGLSDAIACFSGAHGRTVREGRKSGVGPSVMGGHDRDRREPGCDRGHAEDILPGFAGVLASLPTYQPGTQLAFGDALALPCEIADESVPALIRQGDEHDD